MYISLNNILTASNGVFLKKKLDAKDLGKNGLLFYNSLFMIPLALVIAGLSGDLHKVLGYCWVFIIYNKTKFFMK
jgi:solute carrier family 35 protein